MQLVELQEAKEKFRKQGLGLAAVTYDNEATLKEFASLQHVEYPLLADPASQIIRDFRVLDPDNTDFNRAGDGSAPKNMAYPGYFVIDRHGIIREKFFENLYYERRTPGSLIASLFPELLESRGTTISAPHLRIRALQSDIDAEPGNRVSLIAEIELPRGIHIYAPGVKGYIPTELSVKPIPALVPQPPRYPASTTLALPAIHETVPVFQGRFRILQDVFVTLHDRDFLTSVRDSPDRSKKVRIEGVLKYQACDDRVCYPPAEATLGWDLIVKLRKMNPRASPENRRKD